MPTHLPTLKGQVSLASALSSHDDMLLELSFPEEQKRFLAGLCEKRREIELLVSNHLGLKDPEVCSMVDPQRWMLGYYNVCIPIVVDCGSGTPFKRLILRIPLPYKLGESKFPGNADEKLRCEAATFIWMQDHCPEIPIPFLWAFGFQNGQSFTARRNFSSSNEPQQNILGSVFPIMDYPITYRYSAAANTTGLGLGYLLMDYVEESTGKHLGPLWIDKSHEKERRANFFRDLSSIMLTLTRHAFPQVGSLTIDLRGYLRLHNRPLTFRLQQMENMGIPTGMARDTTFGSAEEYLSGLLFVHENRLRYQANAIQDEEHGLFSLSTLDAIRDILARLTNQKGPLEDGLVFSLIDIHPNNVYVDDDWHITCLIDLEWACIRPVEMLLPPVWLTGRRVDELPVGGDLDAYILLLNEFLDAFKAQEESFKSKGERSFLTTQILRDTWNSGNFWLYHGLDNPRVLGNLFRQHISHSDLGKPVLAERENTPAMEIQERTKERAFVDARLRERERYQKRLRQRFEM